MIKPKPTIHIISLFSGAGGLDLGFHQEGFRAALALDADDAAVKTYNANDLGHCAIKCNLQKIKAKDLLSLFKSRAPGLEPRGVIGGPPCQSFSIGNVKQNRGDRRGALGLHYARLLKALNCEFNLDFFVFENVTGLQNPKHRRRYRNIVSALSHAGFNVFTGQLDASLFGIAQRRRRLLLVGINRHKFPWLEFEFPVGTSKKPRTVRETISKLPKPIFFERGLDTNKIPFHENHWTMKPRSPKFSTQTNKVNGDGRSFRRLEWDEPSRAVAYGNREIHLHPRGHRRLSVLEAMLLQGFRADYKLQGTFSEQISQISNAVPPPLAAALARSLQLQLYDRVQAMQHVLLTWFKTNQRDFPWRQAKDPFHVLIAEKLLQQTAATQAVVRVYRKLIMQFPSCEALAKAKIAEVKQIIESLGLHYRASEIIKMAKAIRRQHGGKVPSTLRELMALPGVGDYCARATLAFAYQLQVPIVDTNVARFLKRFFGLDVPQTQNPARNRKLLDIAGALIPVAQARDFNLAILDLCAKYCIAKEPTCKTCPLRKQCCCAQSLDASLLPTKVQKAKNKLRTNIL